MSKPEFPRSMKPLTRHSAELRARILAMLKARKSQNQIARELGISVGTVGYHVSRLRLIGSYKDKRPPSSHTRRNVTSKR